MVMTSSTQNSYISSCPGVASGALACLPTHSCLDDVFARNKKKFITDPNSHDLWFTLGNTICNKNLYHPAICHSDVPFSS